MAYANIVIWEKNHRYTGIWNYMNSWYIFKMILPILVLHNYVPTSYFFLILGHEKCVKVGICEHLILMQIE